MCPRCRQNAPLVYRGLNATCTACGAARLPLTSTSVTLAGQPAKVGGTITRVLGWAVLAGGWMIGALLAGLLAVLNAPSDVLFGIGGTIGVIASITAYALLHSGRALRRSGEDVEEATKNQAIFALARTRNGVLTAPGVAPALQVSVAEADAILTKLAKGYPDYVTVDLDDEGNVLYRFPAIHWGGISQLAPNAPWSAPPLASLATSAPWSAPPLATSAPWSAPPHTRVSAPPSPPHRTRVDAREPLGLEDELEDAGPARQKAR